MSNEGEEKGAPPESSGGGSMATPLEEVAKDVAAPASGEAETPSTPAASRMPASHATGGGPPPLQLLSHWASLHSFLTTLA